MIKYTRAQINKNFMLHDRQFVLVEEATEALAVIAQAAVQSGADEAKLKDKVMQILKGDGDESKD